MPLTGQARADAGNCNNKAAASAVHNIARQSGLAAVCPSGYALAMKAEFTAIIEPAPEGGYWAICPEIPGANGQGETIEETKKNLAEAIQLILEDRRADILRGLPADAIQEKLLVG
jgi:predicted RNase H-like HicB family nuclease